MSNKAKETTMKPDGKPALTPRLRFPEFRDAEGWNETSLGAVARLRNGYAFRSAEYVDSGPYHIITIANVQQGMLSLEATKRMAGLPSDIQEHQILGIGDFLISMTGNVGRVCRVTSDYLLLNQRVGKLIAIGINQELLYQILQREDFRNTMQLKAAGGAQGNLSAGDITEYALSCPTTEPEQQKIAECLSSVDELIAAQARKLDALKTHKKGLMQQLFPREGETQPRLRFPEFQDAGEWEGEDLGSKTTKVGSGITPNGGDKNYKQSGRPFVRSQNVGWGELILDDVAFIDEETHSSFSSTEIQVLDVLLNITGASIGRSAVADGRIAGGNVNQHVCIIRVKAAKLNHFYLNQYLISPEGQKQIDSFQAGGNRQGLNFAQIRSFTIPLPPDVSEQKRIADCLNTLDDLIAAQTQKLAALKTHKKGLMQQLFPSPEEVEA